MLHKKLVYRWIIASIIHIINGKDGLLTQWTVVFMYS